MAVTADPSGVTLQFFQEDGLPDQEQAPFFGQYARFYSDSRPNQLPDSAVNGSADWLTYVLVADSDQELQLLDATVENRNQCATSACSKNVKVVYASTDPVTGVVTRRTLAGQTTIATNKNGVLDRPYTANIVKVMPAATLMGPGNNLWHEWKELYHQLLLLSEVERREKALAAHK